jgi:hypothetical protein
VEEKTKKEYGTVLGVAGIVALAVLFAYQNLPRSQSTPDPVVEAEPSQPPPPDPVVEAEPSQPPPTASELLPGTRVLDEEIMDAPIKTQISLRIAIPGETTKEQLTRYMHRLYIEQMARTGFKARPTPNAVYAFLYTEDVDWTINGAGWVGRIKKAAADDGPTFDNFLLSGSVLEQVRETFTGVQFDLRGSTIHIGYSFDDTFFMADKPTSREISQSMMDALFLSAGMLYKRVRGLDSTEWVFTYHDTTVGRINLTRASHSAMETDAEYHKIMMKVEAPAWDAVSKGKLSPAQAKAREDKAYAAAHRRMLRKLPAGAVNIPHKYRP